jgi:hypothetical protein
MSKRNKIWLLALLVVCVCSALTVAVAVGGPSSSATTSQVAVPTATLDASAPFPDVLPVYFVSGSPYQMGYQYGEQGKDEIVHNMLVTKASALARYGTWAAVVAAMEANTAEVATKTPEVLQVWQGMADGAGVSYDEVRLLNVNLVTPPSCSTISLWGSATKDHGLVAGSNGDSGWLGGNKQGCVLVAYPDNGHGFISSVPICGAWDGIRSMNDKGLVLMMSGGQGAQPGDMAPGYPVRNAYAEIIQQCDTAAQARDMFLGLHVQAAFINHFVDPSGQAFVVESTSRAQAVRGPGDFGEKDYLLATNFYMTQTMRPSNDPDQLQDGDLDDWYRYGTEEQLIKEGYGKLTAGSLMAILGCHDYYGARDPVTGAVDRTKPQWWHRDVLSTQPASDEQSIWTPGMRGISFTPSQREVWLPSQKTLYVLTGNDDPLFSWTADATGEFCKLVLAKNSKAVAAQALADAKLQTWYGAVALHQTRNPTPARLAKLNEAKAAVAKGMNLQVQAALATDNNEAQLLYGQATTCFCRAQCYAEQAQGLVSNSGFAPPSS